MLVKIANCKDTFEGEVVKGLLADNGIDCYLQNETMSQIYGGIQAMEVDVLVAEEDAEKAKELLASRPKEEPVEPSTPVKEPKSIKRQLLESLVFTVFMIIIYLFCGFLKGDFDSFSKYVLYSGCIFLGYFLISLLFNKR